MFGTKLCCRRRRRRRPAAGSAPATEPLLLNLIDGVTMCSTPTACMRRDARPCRPDSTTRCSRPRRRRRRRRRRCRGRCRMVSASANAAPWAWPAAKASAQPATAMAMPGVTERGLHCDGLLTAGCRDAAPWMSIGALLIVFAATLCLRQRPAVGGRTAWFNYTPARSGERTPDPSPNGRRGRRVVASWHQHPLPTLTPAAARAAGGPRRRRRR